MEKQNLNEVISIVADVFSISEDCLRSDTKLIDDLKAKPVNIIRVVVALEDKYYVKIPYNDFPRGNTLGEIARYVAQLV